MFSRQPESSIIDNISDLLRKACHLYVSKDYQRSADLFSYLITQKPLQSELWQGLASSNQALGNFSSALDSWAVCGILNPHDPSVHFYAAHCYIALNNFEEALKALNLALEKPCTCDMIQKLKNMKDTITNGYSG